MDPAQQQIIDRLKAVNNVLVTVSANPTVDQLSACIGLTLLLNKLGKHATAVFSGEVPSTLEFLKPEETIEKNTDSLRDFIIALDKSKADKLRYKVEDKVVKIFITPYRTSISEEDLEFSQGELNVEVIIALGVHEKDDLDKAIAAHGRILHDATIVCVNTKFSGGLGSINWVEPQASSLSEMMVRLGDTLKEGILDEQMSTAFLTGIVAETDRFSNPNTTSTTMNVSAKLMAAGANPQLVAAQLEEHIQDIPEEKPKSEEPESKPQESSEPEPVEVISEEPPQGKTEETEQELPESPENGGALQIDHDADKSADTSPEELELPPLAPEGITESTEEEKPSEESDDEVSAMVTEPPQMGAAFNAVTQPEDENTNPLSELNLDGPLLTHDEDKKDEAKAEESKAPDAGSAPSPSDLLRQLSDTADLPEETNKDTSPQADPVNDLEMPKETENTDNAPATDDAREAVEAAMKEADQPSVTLDTIQSAEPSPVNVSIDPTTGEVEYKEPSTSQENINNSPEAEEVPDNPSTNFVSPPPMPPPIIPPNPSSSGAGSLPPPPAQ